MATPEHNVGSFYFDHGKYAEFEFSLYDTDGTGFRTTSNDVAYMRIGVGTTTNLTITNTVNSSGSICVVTSSSNGAISVSISATDSGSTLSATTYDFNLSLVDQSDAKERMFARGQFIVLTTLS